MTPPEDTEPRRGRKPSPWPPELVAEIAFRLYLSRLDPPLTPAESLERVYRYRDNSGKWCVSNDDTRRKASTAFIPHVSGFLAISAALNILDTNAATNWKPPA